MTKKQLAVLPFCLALTVCQTPPPGGIFSYTATLPNGSHISMTCAPMIDYNGLSANISGVDIPISKVSGMDIKVGTVDLDPTTIRQASDLIEALDNSQFQYCRTLPFVSSSDVMTLLNDFNTQQLALTNLLRNLNAAQTAADAKAAIVTAANAVANNPAPAVVANPASSPTLVASAAAADPGGAAPAAALTPGAVAPAAPVAPTATPAATPAAPTRPAAATPVAAATPAAPAPVTPNATPAAIAAVGSPPAPAATPAAATPAAAAPASATPPIVQSVTTIANDANAAAATLQSIANTTKVIVHP